MPVDVDASVLSEVAITDVPASRRVIVGFDDSQSSHAALAWAAREATARNSALRIVNCLTLPSDDHDLGALQRAHLITALDEVRRRHHGLRLDAADTHVDAQDALLGEAVGAELIVIGASTPGTAQRWLLGSAPGAIARRSSCPVVVVHGSGRQEVRRVVVGVDSSNAASGALDWAVDEANLHGADILIVHAWERPIGNVRSMRTDDLRRADASCALDIAVRSCKRRTLQSVEGTLREGDAATVLVAMTTGTDLLVVGSRGRSGFTTMLFGSLALSVMDNADCPAVVVHPHLRPAV